MKTGFGSTPGEADSSYRFGLVVEAAADARTVQALVDRCLHERIEWLEPEMLDDIRRWQGLEGDLPYTSWTRARALAREHRIQVLGHFDGKPGEHYSRRAYKTLWLFAKLDVHDSVVLVVDADKQKDRRLGFEQARHAIGRNRPVVIGVADPKREAWIIAGFVPGDAHERERVERERRRIGFDPTTRPHDLHGDLRESKTVLEHLLGSDRDREHRCLAEPSLEHLRERGEGCGLTAFLDEVEARLVPVVSGRPRIGPA